MVAINDSPDACVTTPASNQESATTPCCAGHAPVAAVAMVEEVKVLAKCRQSENRAPLYKMRRSPPGLNWDETESR